MNTDRIGRGSWKTQIGLATLVVGIVAAQVCAQSSRAQNDAPADPPSTTNRGVDLTFLNRPGFSSIVNSYSPVPVPAPAMDNSTLLHSLIRGNELELSLNDVLALALENNLDIQVTRFVLADAQTDLLRAKGGGSTQGFNGVVQTGANSVAAGSFTGSVSQSASSSQATGAASVSSVNSLTSGTSSNIGVSCCDPWVTMGFTWDRATTPLSYTTVLGASEVTNQTSTLNTFYGQGFLTGTEFDVGFTGYRQSTTAPSFLLDPDVPGTMFIQVTQPLLRGFGYRANAVSLRVAQNGVKVADSVFRQQVMVTVTQVANYYYDLMNYYQNLQVAQKGLADAEQSVKDNQKEAGLGVIANFDVLRAQNEAAIRRQQLVLAETAYRQQQELLKTAISRQNADPELSKTEVVPTEKLPEPSANDIPPLETAIQEALRNREELVQQNLALRNQNLVVKADRNALLPSLNLFADYLPEGLAGNTPIFGACPAGDQLQSGQCVTPTGSTFSPPVVGTNYAGISQTLSQIFHGRFPEYNFGVNLTIPIRNRVAQATAARALVNQRQMETELQQQRNLVVQDVRIAEINVQEARSAVDVARQATNFAQQTLDGEKQMFRLGKADYFFVTQAAEQLIAAQSAELQARDNYAKALNQFAESTGTTLDRYSVRMDEARSGRVSHREPQPVPSPLPGSNPKQVAGDSAAHPGDRDSTASGGE